MTGTWSHCKSNTTPGKQEAEAFAPTRKGRIPPGPASGGDGYQDDAPGDGWDAREWRGTFVQSADTSMHMVRLKVINFVLIRNIKNLQTMKIFKWLLITLTHRRSRCVPLRPKGGGGRSCVPGRWALHSDPADPRP